MKLTEQDLKDIRQLVRLEVRDAAKRVYDLMAYENPPPSTGFVVVGDSFVPRAYPGPVDITWVEEPTA